MMHLARKRGLPAHPVPAKRRPYTVKSVVHALDILRTFRGEDTLRLCDVIRRTGFHKGMCFRLLHTLHQCGLIERAGLEDIDIGFAFLPAFCGQGYAYESAAAILSYARDTVGLNRVVAITAPDNQRSIRLLKKLGLSFENMLRLGEDQPEVMLFAWDKPA